MVTPIKYKELYDNKVILEFFKNINLKDKRYKRNYISFIGQYLIFRNLTINEFLESLEQQPNNEVQEVTNYRNHLKSIGKPDTTSYVKKFLRNQGVIISRSKQQKQKKAILYYIDDISDKYMLEFMDLQKGLSETSKRRTNRALYEFCQYVELSPTELFNQVETKELDVKAIGRMIISFTTDRTNPTEEIQQKLKWSPISRDFAKTKTHYINEFFKMVC